MYHIGFNFLTPRCHTSRKATTHNQLKDTWSKRLRREGVLTSTTPFCRSFSFCCPTGERRALPATACHSPQFLLPPCPLAAGFPHPPQGRCLRITRRTVGCPAVEGSKAYLSTKRPQLGGSLRATTLFSKPLRNLKRL